MRCYPIDYGIPNFDLFTLAYSNDAAIGSLVILLANSRWIGFPLCCDSVWICSRWSVCGIDYIFISEDSNELDFPSMPSKSEYDDWKQFEIIIVLPGSVHGVCEFLCIASRNSRWVSLDLIGEDSRESSRHWREEWITSFFDLNECSLCRSDCIRNGFNESWSVGFIENCMRNLCWWRNWKAYQRHHFEQFDCHGLLRCDNIFTVYVCTCHVDYYSEFAFTE